jgi:hypothetical protein
VAVYIVLGVLYESFIHPVTILSTLPSAGVGALLALMLFGQDLNVVAMIGIILLIGIVKKNGIMMVDFALDAERELKARVRRDAIYEACLLRFRPILMTTMAALLAGLPLAWGRHRLGAAPPAGYRHGGRTAAEPGADAVYHAGHLHIFRPSRRSASRPRRRKLIRRRNQTPLLRHEHLRALHSSAGGHDSAYRGDRDRRRDRLRRAAGFAAAEGGFSDRSP